MSSVSQHTIRQLKLIVPGGVLVWYFDALKEFWKALHSEADWGRCVQMSSWWFVLLPDVKSRTVTLASLLAGCTTISLFIYVLLTPWIRGVEPDVCGKHSLALSMLTISCSIARGGNLGYYPP